MPETIESDFYNRPLAKPEKPDFDLANLAPLETINPNLYAELAMVTDKLKTALQDIDELAREEESKMACFEAALAFHSQLLELTEEEEFKKLDERFRNPIKDYLKHSGDFIEKNIDYHSEVPEEKK